jgi:hypothetical protein
MVQLAGHQTVAAAARGDEAPFESAAADVADRAIRQKYRAFRLASRVRRRWEAAAAQAFHDSVGAMAEPGRSPEIPLAATLAAERALLTAGPYADCAAISGMALEWVRRLVREIFAMSAAGPQGLAIKMRLLREIMGTHGATEDGDPDLAACQNLAREPFIDSVMRDADRLARAV